MTAKRKRSARGYDHVYQITVDRGICFYSMKDCMVWFTLLCVLSKRYGIRILAVCIMLNHYHIELHAPSTLALSSFMRDLNAIFTRLYNRQYGRSGPLFSARFKNAGKNREHKIRENFLYICNNPVVKRAVLLAEQYRWNFLAYMQSDHPFSTTDGRSAPDGRLEQVKAIIRTRCRKDRPLDYDFFNGLFDGLNEEEKRQATDYAVMQYNVIDYPAIRRMWESYGQLCEALRTVRGAEYDIDDDDSQEDYRHYYKMIRIVEREGYDLRCRRFDKSDSGELQKLAMACVERADASRVELEKFFHSSSVGQCSL